jgi:hypothetical protein
VLPSCAIRRPRLTSSCRIQNPLAGISRTLLLQDVEHFAGKHGLLDVLPLLRKGALVAQDPNSYDEIGGPETLDDSEVDALRDEVLHKWKQSRSLYMTVIMVSSNSLNQWLSEFVMQYWFSMYYGLRDIQSITAILLFKCSLV